MSKALPANEAPVPLRMSPHHGRQLTDLTREAIRGLARKPSRTAVTVLVTTLAVGSLVASLGLTTTARAGINTSFTRAVPTFFVVADTEPTLPSPGLPARATREVDQLSGVRASGILWTIPLEVRAGALSLPNPVSAVQESSLSALAGSPGIFQATGATFAAGSGFTHFDEAYREHVAVVGADAARLLGVNAQSIAAGQQVFVGGVPFAVLGIIRSVANESTMLHAVVVPTETALALWGRPTSGSQLDVLARTGASQLVAREIPVLLHPYDPTRLQPLTYLAPVPEQRQVNDVFGSLLAVVGIVGLCVGLISITSVMLLGVLERTREIGIRRAIGASRSQVALQFTLESTAIGLLGGVIGTIAGLFVVSIYSLAHRLVPVVDPFFVVPDPLIGLLIGLIAGAYPALNAAALSPVDAITR